MNIEGEEGAIQLKMKIKSLEEEANKKNVLIKLLIDRFRDIESTLSMMKDENDRRA